MRGRRRYPELTKVGQRFMYLIKIIHNQGGRRDITTNQILTISLQNLTRLIVVFPAIALLLFSSLLDTSKKPSIDYPRAALPLPSTCANPLSTPSSPPYPNANNTCTSKAPSPPPSSSPSPPATTSPSRPPPPTQHGLPPALSYPATSPSPT